MFEKIFNNKDIIFNEGDRGNSFFQIEDGVVGVYVSYGKAEQKKLTDLYAGQYFGELAVIDGTPRSTTVVADGKVRVKEIPESELSAYFEEDPDKVIEIMNHIGSRIRALTEEYNGASSFLKEFIESDVDKTNTSLMKKAKKYIDIYIASKINLLKPSVESARKSEGKLSEDSSLPIETYKKGTVIFKQGETGNCMYAIRKGVVGIYLDYGTAYEKRLTQLFPCAFFGEMGMLAEEERSATAVAEEDDTSVEIIRMNDLKQLFKDNPFEIDMILCHLSQRLRKLTDDYMDVCKKIYETYK